MTQSEAARIFVDETVPTLEESIDKFAATANRIADELIAARAHNVDLRDALVVGRSTLFNAGQILGSLSRTTKWSRRVHSEINSAIDKADEALAADEEAAQ